MDQSHSYKRCQQMQLKRGLNVAITRNALTQNLAIRGGKCDDTHQYCSNTNGCFYPRKPVTSKQPTCVESEREVNKVNGRLMEAVKGCSCAPTTPRLSIIRETSHTHRGHQKRLERLWWPQKGADVRLSRPTRPRHGRSAAAARHRSDSPHPHPRRSRCRS